MQIHELKPTQKHRRARQVGRGGKRGKTSGRGTKGQLARAGHKLRPELRDIIKKLPKLRGYRFKSFQSVARPINLDVLAVNFAAGERVTPAILAAKGLVARLSPTARVKILGRGALTHQLTVSGCAVSAKARAQIEAAGGQVE
jgi:large subunit ribosomal protein L15